MNNFKYKLNRTLSIYAIFELLLSIYAINEDLLSISAIYR